MYNSCTELCDKDPKCSALMVEKGWYSNNQTAGYLLYKCSFKHLETNTIYNTKSLNNYLINTYVKNNFISQIN